MKSARQADLDRTWICADGFADISRSGAWASGPAVHALVVAASQDRPRSLPHHGRLGEQPSTVSPLRHSGIEPTPIRSFDGVRFPDLRVLYAISLIGGFA